MGEGGCVHGGVRYIAPKLGWRRFWCWLRCWRGSGRRCSTPPALWRDRRGGQLGRCAGCRRGRRSGGCCTPWRLGRDGRRGDAARLCWRGGKRRRRRHRSRPKMQIITANTLRQLSTSKFSFACFIRIRLICLSLAAFAWSNRAIHVRNGAVPAANGAVASQIASAAVCARIIAQSRRHRPCHHLYHLHHLRHQIHPADRLCHHCQPTGWALRLHLAWIKQRGLTASALAVCASRRHYLAVTLAR